MASTIKILHCILLIVLLLIGRSNFAAEDSESKQVLVLFGFSDIGVWAQIFNQTFIEEISTEADIRVTLDFLGLDRPANVEFSQLAESIRLRNNPLSIDLVVAIQPAASSLLHQWGDVFAPNASRLYLFPDAETASDVLRTGSGVILESSMETASSNTLQIMSQLLPDLERVFVVTGDSDSDRYYEDRIRRASQQAPEHLEFIFLSGLAPNELVDTMNESPENSAIFMGTFDYDNAGQLFNTPEISALLADQTSIPIFGAFDSLLNYGAVGGDVSSSALYAQKTAEVSKSMLLGEFPLEPIATPTALIFDGEQLDRFGIDRSLLPETSQLINNNIPLWRQYFLQFALGLVIILIQLGLIIGLYQSLRKRQSAENERDQQKVHRDNQVRLFKSVIDAITDAIVITDPEGKIVTVNRSGFESTFGYSRSEVLGRSIFTLNQAADSQEIPRGNLEDLSQVPSIRRYYQPGGKSFLGEFLGSKITDVTGNTTGYFTLIRDVSERLKKEEELNQAHKMEALGNLAGGIAHDFNNILMAIVGSAEVASVRLEDTQHVNDQLSKIVVASERAKSLVSQILTFSRSSEQEDLIPVNLQGLLKESVALLRASSPKSIELAISSPEDLWDICANATQVQQVLLNLCANAQHAMDHRGLISITASNEHISKPKRLFKDSLPVGDYVLLSIADTGTGITSENLERVFEPFFTTKPHGEGTGMGLALVYGIVKSHEAYIDLQTELGQGTTITLYLKAIKEGLVAAPVPQKISRGNGQVILLVDDEELVIETSTQILAHLGYSVESYTNPMDALLEFESNPEKFDLVISDQSMPQLDGVTLLSEIRKLRPEVPLILCTGYLDAEQQAEAEGFTNFTILNKPSNIAEISVAVSNAF